VITAILFLACAALAAVLRLAVSAPLNARCPIPVGTLTVNVTGSLALGLLAGAGPEVVTVLGAGALGAYTTFSTFSLEVVSLTRRAPFLAGAYVLLSVGACTAAAAIGLALAA
jgi:CrcB protein